MAFVESQETHAQAQAAKTSSSTSGQKNEPQVMAGQSQRADGTWRKPVRVKPGYVAPELVPKYKAPHIRRREELARKAATAGAAQASPQEATTEFPTSDQLNKEDHQKKQVQLKTEAPQIQSALDSPQSQKKSQHPLARDIGDSPEQFSKSPQDSVFGKMQMYSDKMLQDVEHSQRPDPTTFRTNQNTSRPTEQDSNFTEENKGRQAAQQQQQNNRQSGPPQGSRKGNRRRGRKQQHQNMGRGGGGIGAQQQSSSHQYFYVEDEQQHYAGPPEEYKQCDQSQQYYYDDYDPGYQYQKYDQQANYQFRMQAPEFQPPHQQY